ncbi:hypothetical protein RSK20926_11659 [Roseobacter sp. SK209-2-6]|uniref:hypothetical protein n=1 Tax=Roseobacter sp. SK209-2-6 TaxID=388739 RepID=UPI0000F3C806|nr:hypothetical protein [Roseobacter sp. SK209-2-6]EBA18373.1 hypothetical protein RSK20926_11659 [Roseobacter sp. SK209-2-6]
MTFADPEAMQLRSRLESLSALSAAPNSQPEEVSPHRARFGRLAQITSALLFGVVLGVTGVAFGIPHLFSSKQTLDPSARELIVFEIASARDITPKLAEQILDDLMGTKKGAH